tara:strand:- start:118 stop:534 length:417 start_codon:yes stop_codon:yes gene_type:complete
MWDNDNINIEDYYTVDAEDKEPKDVIVEIILGPFTGMKYQYGEFKFIKPSSEVENSSLDVEYEFDVIHVPDEIQNIQYPDEMKESFDRLLMSILFDLVKKHTEKNVRVDYDDTNREGDIDESFERRVFYENSTPVLEE